MCRIGSYGPFQDTSWKLPYVPEYLKSRKPSFATIVFVDDMSILLASKPSGSSIMAR